MNIDDLLFQNRNKNYGAYRLRKLYNKTLAISLLASIVIVLAIVLIPFLININKQYTEDFTIRSDIITADLMPLRTTRV